MMSLFSRNKQEVIVMNKEEKVQIEHLPDVDQMVLDYVKASGTDYAIMLKGAWGAGKTYYWNNALKYDIEEIDSPVKNKGGAVKYKAVHVSLFGIENLNGLIMRMTRAKYISSDKKWVNSIASVAEVAAKNVAKRLEIEGEELESLIAVVKDVDLKRFVFCFDDLERLNKELLLDVLGYINTLIEDEKIKVVVLCNEDELIRKLDNTADEYLTYKEKLIRFTFKISANIEKVLPSLLKDRNPLFCRYIFDNSCFIVDFYKRGKCDNIRTLKFNVEVFEKLYILMASMALEEHKDAILHHYLMLSMLYAIEYKNGESEAHLQDLLELTSESAYAFDFDIHTFNRLAGVETKEEDKEPSYIEKIKEKYFNVSPAKIGSSSSYLEYMKTGHFDTNKLSEDVKGTLSILQDKEMTEEQQLLAVLNNVWIIEDQTLEEALTQLIEKAKKGELSLDLYPAAFSRINVLITKGFIIGPSTDELTKIFMLGIKRAKPRTAYSDKFENGYQVMCLSMDIETKKIADEVLKIYRELEAAEKVKAFHEKFEMLWSQLVDMKDFSSSRIPLMASLKPNVVMKKFLSVDNAAKQRFLLFIQARLEYACTAVPEESKFFTAFKALCESELKKTSKPSIVKRYEEYMVDIITKYNF